MCPLTFNIINWDLRGTHPAQHQRALRKHTPGDDVVLTGALIIARVTYPRAIHFREFHRLVSHLKRRLEHSDVSYFVSD